MILAVGLELDPGVSKDLINGVHNLCVSSQYAVAHYGRGRPVQIDDVQLLECVPGFRAFLIPIGFDGGQISERLHRVAFPSNFPKMI